MPNLKTWLLYVFLEGGEVGIARLHRKIEDDLSRSESPVSVAWERGSSSAIITFDFFWRENVHGGVPLPALTQDPFANKPDFSK